MERFIADMNRSVKKSVESLPDSRFCSFDPGSQHAIIFFSVYFPSKLVYFRDEMSGFNLKKFFLYLLVGSVATSALLGIGVVLFGNFGDFETKILLTALTVTVTSIFGLACGAFLETGRARAVPSAGILSALLSAVLWIILVWHGTIRNDYFVKTLFSATLLAAACSHLSLLSLARLDRRYRWSHYAVQIAVWSLTAILLWLIWIDFKEPSDSVSRVIGVLSIVVGALTVVTPIFHRLSNQALRAEEIDAEIERLKARIEELEKQREEVSKKDEGRNRRLDAET